MYAIRSYYGVSRRRNAAGSPERRAGLGRAACGAVRVASRRGFSGARRTARAQEQRILAAQIDMCAFGCALDRELV